MIPHVAGTVRDATIALLRSFGMTTIFGNPGSTELPMFREFPEDFRYVLGLQESIVVGMADGYAQATRNAAFVNLHSAAGTGHALGNLFTAFKNQTPLVVTAGQQARSILPYEPYLFAEQAAEFPKPYVKWSIEPASAQNVPAAIARAYHVACQPPMGPVFVSIPVDDWDMPCDPVIPRRTSRLIQGDADMLDRVADALAEARNPAFVVGAGVAREDAWDDVIALAERHQASVWQSPVSARNSFPQDHHLFAGFLPAMRDGIVDALADADVVLVLGGPLSIYHVENAGPHILEGTTLFQLVDDPATAACAPVGDAVVTSVAPGVRALLAGREPPLRQPPAQRFPSNAPAASPLTDAYLLGRIAVFRPEGAVIVEEAPSSRSAMHDHLPIIVRDGFYTCASGGLGHGLPAAIGVALGRPKEKIIAILGDGSAMYAIQGLWSAAQLGLAISFVIIRNSRYEALNQFGRHFCLDSVVGTELPEMDFCAMAEGQGVPATSIKNADVLDAALSASFAAKRPTLVEVLVA